MSPNPPVQKMQWNKKGREPRTQNGDNVTQNKVNLVKSFEEQSKKNETAEKPGIPNGKTAFIH